MNEAIAERRQFPRITATLPIRITPDFLGETIDLSETGLRFILEKPLLLSKAQAKIELSAEESIDTEFKVIWNKHLVQEGKFTYGVCFIRLKEKDLSILKRILEKSKFLDKRFVKITQDFRDYLKSIKTEFDEFDAKSIDEKGRIQFIETEKEDIFRKLDRYFQQSWEIVKNFDKDNYRFHKHYYQKMLHPLIEESIEINRHIYRKPLGYSGDYITMNYIYDCHNNKYLGKSSYEKLINNYTCNVPFSVSNIVRKKFFKREILEIMNKKEDARILSVGSGSVRELLELLREGRINKKVLFKCLDFEKKALDYVRKELENIENDKKKFLTIQYFSNNIIDIIRNKLLKKELANEDLIYISGVFDYLKDRLASRLTKELFQFLNKEGILIICNASAENFSHRAYYEMLGEWNMIHRTKEEMLSWVEGFDNISEIKFEQPEGFINYLFLTIKKL